MSSSDLDKQLNQPDEFQTFWAKVAQLFKKYEKQTYALLIAIALVWAGIWGWSQYQLMQEKAAWQAYESARGRFATLDTSTPEKKAQYRTQAVTALNQVIAEHPKTGAADQAHLEIGAILADQGKFKEAADHYRIFLNSLPKNDPMRRVTAQALGQCYEGQGDMAAAEEWYSQLAAWPETADLGLWNLARVQALSGKKEQAKANYNKLLAEHPQSRFAAQVQARLLDLNG